MLDDSQLEDLTETAHEIYSKHMTFKEFTTAMDIRHYPTPTYTYKVVFITLNASKLN